VGTGAAVAATAEEPARAPGRQRRFLIADDLRDAADSRAMLLRLTGHDAHVAYDGEQALELAGATRPDILLLDIGMPNVDFQNHGTRIRVVFQNHSPL
jgi:hypothetical protein